MVAGSQGCQLTPISRTHLNVGSTHNTHQISSYIKEDLPALKCIAIHQLQVITTIITIKYNAAHWNCSSHPCIYCADMHYM